MRPTPGPLSRDVRLRTEIADLLRGGHAHVTARVALAGLDSEPASERANERPGGHAHSLWEVVYHLRFTLADILAFTRTADYSEPAWPDDYWPTAPAGPGDVGRERDAFLADLDALVALVTDPFTDLFAVLPHAPGYTVLREAILAGDHAAYHVAELVSLRRALGLWPPADENQTG